MSVRKDDDLHVGAKMIDKEYQVDLWLEKDQLVPISIKYSHKLGDTRIQLMWESEFMARSVIGSDHLFHSLGSSTTPYGFYVQPASSNETTSHFL
jgi:hypothetical protein